jgi:hypothetical protein
VRFMTRICFLDMGKSIHVGKRPVTCGLKFSSQRIPAHLRCSNAFELHMSEAANLLRDVRERDGRLDVDRV